MTVKEALPHVTTWDISQVPFCLGFHRFLFCRHGEKAPTGACRSSTSSTSLSLGQLGISFNTFRWSGWNTGSTCFPRKKKKKDCYQVLDCRKKRDVLVESNLLGEKCQTISIKELHFFNGIEELLKLIWRDNFSLKNWKIFRKFPISQWLKN